MSKSKMDSFRYIVVGKRGCPFCVKAVKLLQDKNKKFKYIDIQTGSKSDLNYYKRVLKPLVGNYPYIPQVFHRGKFIKGFAELREKLLGQSTPSDFGYEYRDFYDY